MDVLNLYDIEFASVSGYNGRAVVQAENREDAELIVKEALEKNDYVTTPGDVYDVERLDPRTEPGILMWGVND